MAQRGRQSLPDSIPPYEIEVSPADNTPDRSQFAIPARGSRHQTDTRKRHVTDCNIKVTGKVGPRPYRFIPYLKPKPERLDGTLVRVCGNATRDVAKIAAQAWKEAATGVLLEE